MCIQSFKSVRWLEHFLQPVEFSFSLLKQNHEKIEFGVLIEHYFLRGKSIKETEEKLARYYRESAPSHGMVHKWFTEFCCGRISTNDAECPGHRKEVTSQEMIDKIHDIVLNDRWFKVREISETVKFSVGYVWHILHECLGMRKLSARWIPRLLTVDHKSRLVWLRLSNVWACFNVI